MSKESLRQPAQIRRKAAAWMAALAFAGGEGSVLISAGPAQAGAETTHQIEQSPASLISSFDKKLAEDEQLMHSSPHFSSIDAASIKGNPFKYPRGMVRFEYMRAPSQQYPGRYDWLSVVKVKGYATPIRVSLDIGTTSKTYAGASKLAGTSGAPRASYVFNQITVPSEPSLSFRSLSESLAQDQYAHHDFAISSGDYPSTIMAGDYTKYSDNSAKVKAEFDAFLHRVHDTVTRK